MVSTPETQVVMKVKERGFKNIRGVYNFAARFYDILTPMFREGRLLAVDWMQQRGHSSPRVLEVGVGTGKALPLYPQDYKVVGIDFSEGMLQQARKKVEKHNLENVEVAFGDAMDLQFDDNEFDIVIMSYLISTVPDPVKVLNEVKRVCKPSGQILILNHFKKPGKVLGKIEEIAAPLFVRVGWTTDLRLEPLLGKVDLAPDRVKPVNTFGYWSLVECTNH